MQGQTSLIRIPTLWFCNQSFTFFLRMKVQIGCEYWTGAGFADSRDRTKISGYDRCSEFDWGSHVRDAGRPGPHRSHFLEGLTTNWIRETRLGLRVSAVIYTDFVYEFVASLERGF